MGPKRVLMAWGVGISLVLALAGCVSRSLPTRQSAARLLIELPEDCNTPDGCTLAESGDIILSIPNFNSKALLAEGKITAAPPPKMMRIDPQNLLSDWYVFRAQDMHPDTGTVGPMGCDYGPDGHLYVADNQLFSDPAHKSRLLRITCKDGVPTGCDVVVEGFIVSNAVIWRGDTVYVSETILQHSAQPGEGEPTPSLTSGVYAIHRSEWEDGPVKLRPYTPENPDPHLVAVYATSNRVGFGADGLTFDADGNLYCGIFEDGLIYKTTFTAQGRPTTTRLFASDPAMACCDGIFWRRADNCIYVADMLRNAVQVVDMRGSVFTLHANGDTTGSDGGLDQPCEVLVRGDELIVINMDMPWESDLLTNKAIDTPYTISVIPLK